MSGAAVLIVDDDATLRGAVVNELARRGYQSAGAASYREALAALAARPFDVVVTDLRMDERDGIDLLTAVRELPGGVRTVLMSAYASARDYQTAVELGAVRVLCKPFSLEELLDAIEHAIECDDGFRGSFHGLSLIDMLQMFHYARRTITVHVEHAARQASIAFEDGEIVHASDGVEQGLPALRKLLAKSTGLVRTAPRGTGGLRTIELPFSALILDLLREIDEASRPGEPVPPVAEGAGADPALDHVRHALARNLPDAQCRGLRRGQPDGEPLAAACEALLDAAERIAPGVECIEAVGTELAFALLSDTRRAALTFIDVPLGDRFSAIQFRGAVQRLRIQAQLDK